MKTDKNKRYVVSLDVVLYARNDKEAKVKAAKMNEKMNLKYGGAISKELCEVPYATLEVRKVCSGDLRISHDGKHLLE